MSPEADIRFSGSGSESGSDYPDSFSANGSALLPQTPSSINGSLLQKTLLDNTTRLMGNPHTTRNVQMKGRVKPNMNPQYGSFFSEYDPMTGARTAAILGSFLLLLVVYIIYKAKCHEEWTEEDDFYLQQYKQRQQNKAMRKQQTGARKSVHYVIDPVCNPDPKTLAATAQWVKLQPLEDAVPAALPGEKRRKRCTLTKIPSVSAENINWQMLNNSLPPIPNGSSPTHQPDRSCNQYVPNGFLKTVDKECLQDSSRQRDEIEGKEVYLNLEGLCAQYENYCKGQNLNDDEYLEDEEEDENVFVHVEIKPEDPLVEHCPGIDWENNNQHNLISETPNTDMNYCSNCLSDTECKNCRKDYIQDDLSIHNQHLHGCNHHHDHCHHYHQISNQQRQSHISPSVRDISHGRRPERSRFRAKPKQRSLETGSSFGSSSQQQSLDEDSPEFCVSGMPARDAAPGSLDINDLSSNENTSDQGATGSTMQDRSLSFVKNATFNSTFSTLSTTTASSNGSCHLSEEPDIPLAELQQNICSIDGATAVISQQPKDSLDKVTSPEMEIVVALESSSKSHEEMDTKL